MQPSTVCCSGLRFLLVSPQFLLQPYQRCERCNQTGATVGCCLTSCQSNYHFMCARSRQCVFQDDKKVYCHKHRHLISGRVSSGPLLDVETMWIWDLSELPFVFQMITGQEFEVNRRVYVDFEGISLRRKFLTGLEPELINVMIGISFISYLMENFLFAFFC